MKINYSLNLLKKTIKIKLFWTKQVLTIIELVWNKIREILIRFSNKRKRKNQTKRYNPIKRRENSSYVINNHWFKKLINESKNFIKGKWTSIRKAKKLSLPISEKYDRWNLTL